MFIPHYLKNRWIIETSKIRQQKEKSKETVKINTQNGVLRDIFESGARAASSAHAKNRLIRPREQGKFST